LSIGGFLFYVYQHRKADSREIFYVGKGKGSRAFQFGKTQRSRYWINIVKKHGLIVEILKNFSSESDAFEFEKQAIAILRESGTALVNILEGGQGFCGGKHSDEFKERHRQLMLKNNPFKGQKHSQETLQKMREKKLGKRFSHSEETKEKMRNARRNAKKIVAFYDGALISEFKSMSECSRITKVSLRKIAKLLRNEEDSSTKNAKWDFRLKD
jgi:group I intron endonuclease